MIIKVLLIIGFVTIVLKFLSDPTTNQVKAWQKILGILFVFTAVFVVVFPNSTNDLAHRVGVSRGADLLLYLLTLAFIFVCLNIYIKEKHDQRRIVELARKVALLEASFKKTKNDGK